MQVSRTDTLVKSLSHSRGDFLKAQPASDWRTKWTKLRSWALRLLRQLIPADFHLFIDLIEDDQRVYVYILKEHEVQRILCETSGYERVSDGAGLAREVAERARGSLGIAAETDVICARVVTEKPIAFLVAGATSPKRFEKRDELAIRMAALAISSTIHKQRMKYKVNRLTNSIATLGEIGNLLTSSLMLEDVLSEIIDKVKETLNVEGVGVLLHEAETDELVLQKPAFNVTDDSIIQVYREPVSGNSNAAQVFRSGLPYVSNNALEDGRIIRKYVELFKVKNTVSVPLKLENRSIGVLHVINKRKGNFTDKDVNVLMVLASQLAIVISNARLFAETKKKEQEARALYEVATEISALHDLEQILGSIVHKVRYLLPCDIVGIGLPDEESTFIRIKVWAGDRVGVLKDLVIRPGTGVTGLVLSTKKPQQVSLVDASGSQRNPPPDDIELIAKAEGIASVLAIPMIVGEKVAGVIYACRRKSTRFTVAEAELLSRFSGQAAIALENCRLYEKEKENVARLRELHELSERQRNLLENSLRIHQDLTSLVLEAKGLEAITRTLAELVSNPVLVCDQFFKVLSRAAPDAASSAVLDDLERLVSSLENDSQWAAVVSTLRKERRPRRVELFSYGSIANPVIVGSEIFGYLVAIELGRPMTELDVIAMEHAATIVALEMMRRKTIFEVESKLKGDFMDDLLNGRLQSPEEIIERANFLGYDLRKPYQVMIADIDDFRGFIQRKSYDERTINSVKRRVFEVINNVVTDRSPRSILVTKSDSIVILACASPNGNGENSVSYVPAKRLAEAIKTSLSRVIPDLTLSIGIGRVCDDVKELQKSYSEAMVCLNIAKRFQKRNVTLAHSDLGVYSVLSRVNSNEELSEYVDRFLGRILEYDNAHDGSLLETLRVYLNNNCNRQKTAESSYVHLNTVNYRLRRIEEITGLDLSDPETRLNVHVALKILDIFDRN